MEWRSRISEFFSSKIPFDSCWLDSLRTSGKVEDCRSVMDFVELHYEEKSLRFSLTEQVFSLWTHNGLVIAGQSETFDLLRHQKSFATLTCVKDGKAAPQKVLTKVFSDYWDPETKWKVHKSKFAVDGSDETNAKVEFQYQQRQKIQK